MSAEFTNIIYDLDKTLRHCFRAQAARCHEYIIFVDRMKTKYPDMDLANISAGKGNEVQLTFTSTNNWKNIDNQLKNVDGFSFSDRNIFAVKYSRMLEAKKLFQRLGGDYEKFR